MHDRSGDRAFFEFVAPDACVFTIDNATKPIIGRAAFIKVFDRALTAIKRKVEVLDEDLKVSENQGVLAQTLQITAQGVTSHVRQSVIWERNASGAWLMTHIHNAIFGQPVVDRAVLGSRNPVRLLNDI